MTALAAGTVRLKILLVEDEPLIALTITDILEEFGHHVLEAVSAEEAVMLFEREGGVDMLITDLGLPDQPGDVLAQRLRAQAPTLPVLFATGRSADFAQGETALPPPCERLAKPFLMHDLQAAIERLLAVSPR